MQWVRLDGSTSSTVKDVSTIKKMLSIENNLLALNKRN